MKLTAPIARALRLMFMTSLYFIARVVWGASEYNLTNVRIGDPLSLWLSMTCSIGFLFRHPPKGYLNHRLIPSLAPMSSHTRPCLFKVPRGPAGVPSTFPPEAAWGATCAPNKGWRELPHSLPVLHGFCSIFIVRGERNAERGFRPG